MPKHLKSLRSLQNPHAVKATSQISLSNPDTCPFPQRARFLLSATLQPFLPTVHVLTQAADELKIQDDARTVCSAFLCAALMGEDSLCCGKKTSTGRQFKRWLLTRMLIIYVHSLNSKSSSAFLCVSKAVDTFFNCHHTFFATAFL